MKKRILLLLGGTWHDFSGFAGAMQALYEPRGWEVEPTYELGRLLSIDHDVVLSYTCMSVEGDGRSETWPKGMTDAQVEGLASWVRAGGGLLAAHAATVVGNSAPALGALLGGTFLSHPPAMPFTIVPMSRVHPITDGVEAFSVDDELYIQRYDASVHVHMVALHDNVAHPMVWTRREGAGKVAHVALGHSEKVWAAEPYRRLMTQAMAWLVGAVR
jgi:uncharacterized protein